MSRVLHGIEERAAKGWFKIAAETALKSSCLRSKCGSVVVKGEQVIGVGYNSPPGDIPPEKCLKDEIKGDDTFISDATCCVHAEDRAIRDALAKHSWDGVRGARLYFVRIDESGNIKKSGDPYCTWCSKTALDERISKFVLWHEKGITEYDTEEYNKLSYEFRRKNL